MLLLTLVADFFGRPFFDFSVFELTLCTDPCSFADGCLALWRVSRFSVVSSREGFFFSPAIFCCCNLAASCFASSCCFFILSAMIATKT